VVVVPAASNIAQKLQMRRKPVNIDNIEEAVKKRVSGT